MAQRQSQRSRTRKDMPGKSAHELLSGSVPPSNLDAERTVLGSILRDNSCFMDVAKLLPRPDHFYSAKHQKLYEVMLEMFENAVPIDAVSLGEELAKKGWLMDVGGAPSIVELFEETLAASNVAYSMRIVHEKAVLRQLIHSSTEILRDAYENTGSADELLADAEKKIFKILEYRLTGDVTDIKEVLNGVFDRISMRHKRDGTVVGGIPSPFHDLDEMTNGWQDSELVILAARPSMGKTAFALNLVEHAAVDCEMPVLFVSLEMSQLELAERLLCARSGVNGHSLRRGVCDSSDMQKLVDKSEELSQAPLFIDDTPAQTMLRIAATARRLRLRSGLKMIVVDYMQLIEADDRLVSRQEQISTISRRLKNLARELQVPVIALSQLNRGVEAREGHRPRMSDLRESGSIEQDADVVMLLHRDDVYDPENNPGTAEVIVAKQRNGPIGDVKLTFLKELTRFEGYAPEISAFDATASEF